MKRLTHAQEAELKKKLEAKVNNWFLGYYVMGVSQEARLSLIRELKKSVEEVGNDEGN
jgi:hypothetical protein